jgi:hypothetical protein
MEIDSIAAMSGDIMHSDDVPYYVIPCIHPGAIARKPQLKKYFIDCIYVAAETLKALEESKDNQ